MSEQFQHQVMQALDNLKNGLENQEFANGRVKFSGATYAISSSDAMENSSSVAQVSVSSSAPLADNSNDESETQAVLEIAKDLIELQRSLSGLSNNRNNTSTSVSASNAISNNSVTSKSPNNLNDIEQAILRSTIPINIMETEEVTINGITGILANKFEIDNWRGEIPLCQYSINEDQNPEIITKKSQQQIEYVQELAIRYLRPPTPPAPGEIVIQQESNICAAPAPPLVLRQQPPRPDTPEPLVIREAPPQPPQQVGRKVITISGKNLPPPPRKVVIERLAPLPSKPQSVIVERWLPYSQAKRRVIFNRPCAQECFVMKPRNVIIQWEAPQVLIKKEFKYLGVIRANPAEYVQRFGPSLKLANELPDFVVEIKPPEGIVLAADHKSNNVYELEGDVEALRYVDLEKEGLGEYRQYLENLNSSNTLSQPSQEQQQQQQQQPQQQIVQSISFQPSYSTAFSSSSSSQQLLNQSLSQPQLSAQVSAPVPNLSSSLSFNSNTSSFTPIPQSSVPFNNSVQASLPTQSTTSNASSTSSSSQLNQLSELVEHIFRTIDRNNSGRIGVEDAEKVLLRLNSRLGKRYGEDDVKALFTALDINRDNFLDLNEFKNAFLNLAYTA